MRKSPTVPIRQVPGLHSKTYTVAVFRQPEVLNDTARLTSVLRALSSMSLDMPVVLPLPPPVWERVQSIPEAHAFAQNLYVTAPLHPENTDDLLRCAALIVTACDDIRMDALLNDTPCVLVHSKVHGDRIFAAVAAALVAPRSLETLH